METKELVGQDSKHEQPEPQPVLDPEKLYEAAKKGIGLPLEEMFDTVQNELVNMYPGRINKKRRWIFNVAGGVMGQLTVLFASPHEYLLFFGSPIGSEGHSGRYNAEIWDFCMSGEFWLYVEGQLDRTVVTPGDVVKLPAGKAKGFKMPDHGCPCYMLEYGRGNIPSVFPFGVLSETLTSTHDWPAMWNQIIDYAKLTMREVAKGEVGEIMQP